MSTATTPGERTGVRSRLLALSDRIEETPSRSSARPREGREISLRVDDADLRRARTAARALGDETGTAPYGTTAVSLEVALQEPVAFLEDRDRPITMRFDVADAAFLLLALRCRVGDLRPFSEERTAYREQVRRWHAALQDVAPDLAAWLEAGE